ncbi:MAG: histidine phosphatase family protein [Burkholderiaceae bacterium]|nr:histidine phosphatase family protein [Burkholderiaceae bacterium]
MIDRRRLLAGAAGLGLARPALGAVFDARSHGLVVMLRHALTEPGVGDPPGWRLDDCGSQRNLSAEGRAQAQRLGAVLAAQGLRPARVRSSRWCRCLDTGRLAFGGAEPWPALDSFFDDRSREPAQTAALREALLALAPGEVQAWVTHQVNISALAGESTAMGEALVLRGERQPDGGVRVLRLGRIDAAARG